MTRLNFGMGRKPNLRRTATESVGRNFGGRGSTPYVCMHQLSAMFCTATAVVVVHVKTLPEIAGETWRLKAPFGLGLEETETPA